MAQQVKKYGDDFVSFDNIVGKKENIEVGNTQQIIPNDQQNDQLNFKTNEQRKSSIGDMILDIIKKIKYKHIILLFILFILLNSDLMIEKVLSNFSGAVEQRNTTGYGVFIQGLLFVLGFLIIDTIFSVQH